MHTFIYNGRRVNFDESVDAMYLRHFTSQKFYEHDFLRYIQSLGLVGTYLDIGAHVGNHTIFFGMFCESLVVIAFEPLSGYVNMINKNLLLNDLQRKSIVIPLGLSDDCQIEEIVWNNSKEPIITTTLDKITSLLAFPRPIVVIKIDIEGMESKALNGARNTINLHKPIVFAEAHDNTRDILFSTMESLNYRWSGKVFNASPTYEFIPYEEKWVTTELTATKKELQAVKSSISYQLGYALTRSIRKPGRNTLLLPYRLLQLVLRAVKRK